MCSLEELTPGQSIPGGAAWKAYQWNHPPSDPAPVWFYFTDLSDAQNLMQTLHPGEGFQLFLKTTPRSWTAMQRFLPGRHWGHLSLNLPTGHSHSWRVPEKCTQWHWTAPSPRQKPHQSAGTLKPCKSSISSTWKRQMWQSSLGLEHPLQWMRHPSIRGWASTKPLRNAGIHQFGKSKD